MTSQEKDDLRKLHAAACTTPWMYECYPNGTHDVTYGPVDDPSEQFSVIDYLCKENAVYIVAACNAVPDLLDEIEQLRRVCKQLLDATNTVDVWSSLVPENGTMSLRVGQWHLKAIHDAREAMAKAIQ